MNIFLHSTSNTWHQSYSVQLFWRATWSRSILLLFSFLIPEIFGVGAKK